MMVCHCNAMSSAEIRDAVRQLRRRDGRGIVTPGRVFACRGKRPNCGGCMPLVSALIEETVVEPHSVRTDIVGVEVAGVGLAGPPVARARDAA
jgi:bacterioferritin-associated ferredoxin